MSVATHDAEAASDTGKTTTGFREGDIVTVHSPGKVPQQYKLAAKDNVRVSPVEVGPTHPVYVAIIGKPYNVGEVEMRVTVKVKLARKG